MKELESRPPRDERLRALLREADAAAEAPDLAPAEVSRLRRLALASLSSPRPPRFAAPAWSLVVAAAALVALAVGLSLLMRAVQPAPPARTAAAPPAPAVSAPTPVETPPQVAAIAATEPAATAEKEPRADPGTPTVATRPRPHRGDVVLAARQVPAPAASEPPAAIATNPNDRRPVQLQLTAPGGTRIVWVLDPSTSSSR